MDRDVLERVETLLNQLASEPAPVQNNGTLTTDELDALMAKQAEWSQSQADCADPGDIE